MISEINNIILPTSVWVYTLKSGLFRLSNLSTPGCVFMFSFKRGQRQLVGVATDRSSQPESLEGRANEQKLHHTGPPIRPSVTPYTWAENFESFERINSIRETNGNFDSCNSCKQLGTSRLHELHESKFPFVSRIEFIRSKLSKFSAHVYGAIGAENEPSMA